MTSCDGRDVMDARKWARVKEMFHAALERGQDERADFVARFTKRPYFFVRAATPQVLLDQVDRVL